MGYEENIIAQAQKLAELRKEIEQKEKLFQHSPSSNLFHWSQHLRVGDRDEQIEKCLRQGADPNWPSGAGSVVRDGTVLHYAILIEDRWLLRKMLAHDADPHQGDAEGYTPLHWAALMGQHKMLAELLKKSGHANPRNASNETPAMCLFRPYTRRKIPRGKTKLVVYSAVLTTQVRSGQRKCLELLLKAGADPNAENGSGASLLTRAIQFQRLDFVKIILSHPKTDPTRWPKNATYKHCRSPLEYAQEILKEYEERSLAEPTNHAMLDDAVREARKIVKMLEHARGN